MMTPDQFGARARLGPAGRPASSLVRFVRAIGLPLVRALHRATLTGTENLPKSGAFILVANHSAAIATAELASFASLYIAEFGGDRPLAGFAHPAMFHLWPVSALLRATGAVPSTYAAAEATLAAGVPLLVFPGGDHEAFRPVWHANTVDFGGRLGFLRIAQNAGVPIVPMGIRGSHFTAPILWKSTTVLPWLLVLPRLFGVKRYPLTLLGLMGIAAIAAGMHAAWPWRIIASWVWLASTLPPLVGWIPWTIRIRIGEPIAPGDLFDSDRSDASLRRSLARVESAVASLIAR